MRYLDHLAQPSYINGKWMYIFTHTQRHAHTQQTLQWACLATTNNPYFVSISILLDQIWYHNPNPHEGPFSKCPIITRLTITYEEPTIPPKLRIGPRTESHAIQVLCLHHKNTFTGSNKRTQWMNTTTNTLQIPQIVTQVAPLTPLNTPSEPQCKMV